MRKNVDDLGAFFSHHLKKLTAEVNFHYISSKLNLFSQDELINLALDFKVTARMLSQIEEYYHKEIRSSRLVLQPDHDNPSKMSFYEPECNTTFISEARTTPDRVLEDSPTIQHLTENSISEIPIQPSKKKQSKSRRSLLGMLSKQPTFPRNSYLKAPLSTFSNKSADVCLHSNSMNIDKITRINDSQNLDVEDLHNISQSTETQTHAQSNIGNSHSLNLNSPQTLLLQKLDELNTSEIKHRPELGDETSTPLPKADSPTQHLVADDNEVPIKKIPHSEKLKQVLGLKNLDTRNRSNSFNEPWIQKKSQKANNKTNPYPLTNSNNNSMSFLTEKPDDVENGYFDDEIKEELQRETAVFTPKVNFTLSLTYVIAITCVYSSMENVQIPRVLRLVGSSRNAQNTKNSIYRNIKAKRF